MQAVHSKIKLFFRSLGKKKAASCWHLISLPHKGMGLANFPNMNKCTSQKIQIYTVDQKNSNADFCGMNVASPLNANQISMASNSSHLKIILPRNFFPTQNLIKHPFQNHRNSQTFSQLLQCAHHHIQISLIAKTQSRVNTYWLGASCLFIIVNYTI